MEIRKLIEDDLASLAGLYQQFWGEVSSVEKMRTTFQRLKRNPNYIFLVAEQQNRLVGSVTGIICEELYGDCKPFLVVEDVIVDQHHRRLGIGSSLMRELERYAVKSNCNYIIFVTELERTEAHRFYESIGYKSDAYKGFKKRLKTTKTVPLTARAMPFCKVLVD
ncbi:MAG: GNAT family N-acetyltransferase [Desulfobacterales bacterium]|nr:MAG: GNAT family N-acetyltransferase [Desulfobacterales bacterium]